MKKLIDLDEETIARVAYCAQEDGRSIKKEIETFVKKQAFYQLEIRTPKKPKNIHTIMEAMKELDKRLDN